MDPVGGPWYASYNRLATPTATFQSNSLDQALLLTSATGTSDTSASNTIVTSTNAPQIILQAAHTTSTPFNTGGFLSTSTGVGYDVFSPFFTTSKQTPTTQYVTQPLRTQVVTNSKPSSPEEDSDIPSLRSSYASPQQNDVSCCFLKYLQLWALL